MYLNLIKVKVEKGNSDIQVAAKMLKFVQQVNWAAVLKFKFIKMKQNLKFSSSFALVKLQNNHMYLVAPRGLEAHALIPAATEIFRCQWMGEYHRQRPYLYITQSWTFCTREDLREAKCKLSNAQVNLGFHLVQTVYFIHKVTEDWQRKQLAWQHS